MLEPNEDLEKIFERAIQLSLDNHHQYITLEHFLYCMVTDEAFNSVLVGYGTDVADLTAKLENYIKNDLVSIVDQTSNSRPKKTNSVERMLNRAFTHTLFSGRTTIEPIDCFLSILNEKKSHAAFYLRSANIEKDKFIEYVNKEIGSSNQDGEEVSVPENKLEAYIGNFCTNLNAKVKNK